MSMPTPFETGRAISSNISGAFAQARETSAIDQILQEANSTGDQEAIDNALFKILSQVSPQRQGAALKILQAKQNQLQQRKFESQQKRLQLDSVLKRYNYKIKELDAEIKDASYSDRKGLKEQKKALQDERDALLDFDVLAPKLQGAKRVKFDISNPEHKKRRDEVLSQAGDRAKAQEILEKEFEL